MAFTDDMQALAQAVVEDLSAGSVTWRRRARGDMDTTTLRRATTDTEATVAAVRYGTRRFHDPQSGAAVEEGRWTLRAADLSGEPPKAEDEIVDAGTVYNIVRVERAADANLLDITGRRKV